MHKIKTKIWDREFSLNVFYQTFDNEETSKKQVTAFSNFLNAENEIEKSKENVIAYIEKYYAENLDEERITNIFRYVIPKEIYVPANQETFTVAILCDFKFDMEHGIAVIFENEKCVDVSSQDEIL